jgi:UDP-2,4-diacetamido-2,4,6-trideoxy-beta-L-altropyranose hydrolase
MIIFRTDAADFIGTGHIMRCLVLAEALRDKKQECQFITRAHPTDLVDYLRSKDWPVHVLPQIKNPPPIKRSEDWLLTPWENDARETQAVLKEIDSTIDALVVDHYGIPKEWESALRPMVKKICVIDDLPKRKHDCDIFLNQNFHPDMHERHKVLLPQNCEMFLGPKYALLRQEFRFWQTKRRIREGPVRRILIFFGGTDPTGETLKTLKAIDSVVIPANYQLMVMVGIKNAQKKEISDLASRHSNWHISDNVSRISDLLASTDLAIGAGGVSTWERAYMGLPSLLISVAENQVMAVEHLGNKKIAINLGYHTDVDAGKMTQALISLIENPSRLKQMSEDSMKLFSNQIWGSDVLTEALLR